jgi:hypothetical protein
MSSAAEGWYGIPGGVVIDGTRPMGDEICLKRKSFAIARAAYAKYVLRVAGFAPMISQHVFSCDSSFLGRAVLVLLRVGFVHSAVADLQFRTKVVAPRHAHEV